MNDKAKNKTVVLVEMLTGGTVTVRAVMFNFGVDERYARRMLSDIAKAYPLIAVSDRKGYRIATSAQDIDDVRHAYNENRKRAAEVLKRNAPLEKFLLDHGEAV